MTAESRVAAEHLASAIATGTSRTNAPATLRAEGPDGLAILLAELDRTNDAAARERLKTAIDAVAKQKDASVARLYWYTDLDAAKEAALARHKPILSLRLLGNLDDELSCANSRFFRTALYPNAAVSSYLRDHFVLHWSSERPAPVMTIDFRDGRKIQRTVTGNSIHYVLDETGRPVDAIPGLYGPSAFLDQLVAAEQLARLVANLSGRERRRMIAQSHAIALTALSNGWRNELAMAGVKDPSAFALPAPPPSSDAPAAVVAAPIAATKAAVEAPLVRAVMPSMQYADDALPWAEIARRHAGEAQLDARATALMRAKNPMSWSDTSAPKPLDDVAFRAMVTSFESLMTLDGLKNEYKNHSKIHEWFVANPDVDFDALNARVYREIFLTPKSDPWLGLVPPGVYSGIANDGVAP